MMRRLLFLAVLVVVLSPVSVCGWGKDGHELVGNIAYRLLSKEAQSAVQEILAHDVTTKVPHHRTTTTSRSPTQYNNTPLGAIADWADQVRISKEYHWSGALHYIDIHDELVDGGCPAGVTTKEGCQFEYDRDCKNDVCVAGAIVNYTNHLAEWVSNNHHQKRRRRLEGSMTLLLAPFYQATTWQETVTKLVQESLKFLTHFVGDIHQPLHSGRQSDIGGNRIDVTFQVPRGLGNQRATRTISRRGERSLYTKHHHHMELHGVWDTSIIERAIHTQYDHSRQALEEDLLDYIHQHSASDAKEWLACADTSRQECTTQWAQQSWIHALTWAYLNADGHSEVTPGTHLADQYYETRWPKIFQYLAVAGVRLAAALERVLGHGRLLSLE